MLRRGIAIGMGLLLAVAVPALGQGTANALIPDSSARRLGLVRDWYAQVAVDRGQGKLIGLTQHVSDTQSYVVYEVDYGGGKELFSQHDLNQFGDPIEKEGAKRKAEERAKQMKAQQLNPKITERTAPVVALFATTNRGTVQAIDGASGRTIWSAMYGRPDYPTMPVGANDKYVAVLNGSTLYMVNRVDGRLLWDRPVAGAPGAGPAVADYHVFVPLVTGVMEVFEIENPKAPSRRYQSYGRAMVQPTVTSGSAVWPTDQGYIFGCRVDGSAMRFRMEARNTIVAPVTSREPVHLFAASVDGSVYCLHQRTGDLIWRFSTGEAMSDSPAVIDDAVYVTSNNRGIYRLNANSGQQQWFTDGVDNFLAAGKRRVYCTSSAGRLMVLDAATGGLVGGLPIIGLEVQYQNTKTDRIFLASETGLVQCLREAELDLPVVYNSVAQGELIEKTGAAKAGKKPPKPAKEAGGEGGQKAPAKPATADDVFGGGGEKKEAPPKAPAKPKDDDPFK